MKSDADIMHESREYIRKNGWTTDTMRDDAGRVCGYGAVMWSQGWAVLDESSALNNTHQERARVVLAKVLTAIGVTDEDHPQLADFTGWNDDMAENQQQVEDAFAKAEKIERAGFDPDA
jgi:hypothetical protein